ncbi:MAG: hypothetical protein MUF52_06385 [Syntrophobacteraceae bacterium]|nr:hypothetical protein [Syntrophobacteraceae bacterium]
MTEEKRQSQEAPAEFTGCRFHPHRPAMVRCNKYELHYCQECVDNCSACTDPNLYCQHRNQCFIWEKCRREMKRRRREGDCSAAASQ